MIRKFLETLESAGDRLAVRDDAEGVSCAALATQVETLRTLFRAAARPPLVLVALPSGPFFTAVQLAALAERVIVAPVPPTLTDREARGYLQLTRPDLLVADSTDRARPFLDASERPLTVLVRRADDSLVDPGSHRIVSWTGLTADRPAGIPLQSAPRRELPEATALVHFTSGSTGAPKGILLSEENVLTYLEAVRPTLAGCAGRHVLCSVPQYHSFGWRAVLEHLVAGASVHVSETFLPGEHLASFGHHGGSAILASPTYTRLLLRMNALEPEHLPTLASLTLGTESVDPGLVREIRERFPEITIHLQYGLTETAGHATQLTLGPGELLEAPGLVGFPLPGVVIATAPEGQPEASSGEVRIRSSQVAIGRLNSRDRWTPLIDAAGFLHTGDLGELDAEGRLRLCGRISTFIKRHGYRIDPREIECVLEEHAAVAQAVVVGLPDPLAGQKIVACVAAAGEVESAELLPWCRQHLSTHKVPQLIRVVPDLPRLASGKADRREVARLLGG